MREVLIGVDIGGTKCAVVLGTADGEVLDKVRFPTETSRGPEYALDAIGSAVETIRLSAEKEDLRVVGAGVSCGGPLDPKAGIVLSPPNLPGWDEIPITEIVSKHADAPTALLNDADAGALAEFRFGAGRGTNTMVFLTFGTGLGAGLVLDGRLFTGASGLAGEVGHIRIADDGPECYGKSGSFEGYCSGTGIALLAKRLAADARGDQVDWSDREINAERVADAARLGDPLASEVFRISGTHLGKGCAMLIDLLNPDMIVAGSVYARCRELLEPHALEVIEREALPGAAARCRLVPAELGEKIGDIASLCAALEAVQ